MRCGPWEVYLHLDGLWLCTPSRSLHVEDSAGEAERFDTSEAPSRADCASAQATERSLRATC